MRKILKLTAALLAVLMLLSLAACGLEYGEPTPAPLPVIDIPVIEQTGEPSPAPESEPSQIPDDDPTEVPDPTPIPTPEQTPDSGREIDRDGYYYDVEGVVLYLDSYGELPPNYITKSDARKLGWEGGTPEKYRAGSAIGGDSFGNFEGLLPKAGGRSYTECDIDTEGKSSRGAKRLIFSNDGLYFYTDDHYESFTEVYVTGEGTVEWK